MESAIHPNHHAYCIEGDLGLTIANLILFLDKHWNVSRLKNPDFYLWEGETFGIEDARKLQDIAATKPVSSKRVYIIAGHFFGHEAQNALLKILEEPIANAYFFVITDTSSILLPTVRSRMSVVRGARIETEDEHDRSIAFLRGGFETRTKMLAEFANHENDERKSDLIRFINSLEIELADGLKKGKHEYDEALSDLLFAKKSLFERSPSVKMIADYIALRLPKI